MPARRRHLATQGGGSLYDLLRVPKGTSDPSLLRRAFRAVARELHPDKHPTNQKDATVAFQQLKRAFDILVDPHRRELYDSNGYKADDGSDFVHAHALIGAFSQRVPQGEFERMIHEFETTYKGSTQERADVLEFVRKHQGNASHMIECIIVSSAADVDRFVDIVRAAFENGDLPHGLRAKFDGTVGIMRKKAQKEQQLYEKELRRAKPKKAKEDATNLALAIRANKERRSSVLLSLPHDIPEDPLAGRDLAEIREQCGIKRKPSTAAVTEGRSTETTLGPRSKKRPSNDFAPTVRH